MARLTLALVMTSGSTSKFWYPHILPVRPIPVCAGKRPQRPKNEQVLRFLSLLRGLEKASAKWTTAAEGERQQQNYGHATTAHPCGRGALVQTG